MSDNRQSSGMENRQFPMTDDNFRAVKDLAYRYTGINLTDKKREMIYSRLSRRIRRLKLNNFTEYTNLIVDESNPEIPEFINAITTNLTSFFRENHHFEFMKSTVLPDLRERHKKDHRIRMWCCAASTGEEPYSIAMVVNEMLGALRWDIKLLATDLDSNVIEHAKQGIYNKERIRGMSDERIRKWFDPVRKEGQKSFMKVKPGLQNLITFKCLNLLERWPMSGPFDVIFCRNVVIYFDKPTQKVLFDRLANLMAPGAYLFIGHSESLYRVSDRFENLGHTVYRKLK